MVRFIPKSLHGVADYLVGIGMILMAFLWGSGGVAFWIFLVLGAFAIIYSLMTDYPLGWKPILTMPAHLALDAVFAVVMLALPLVISMPKPLFWIAPVIGMLAALLVATTRMQ
jgi:hypothetical protein